MDVFYLIDMQLLREQFHGAKVVGTFVIKGIDFIMSVVLDGVVIVEGGVFLPPRLEDSRAFLN